MCFHYFRWLRIPVPRRGSRLFVTSVLRCFLFVFYFVCLLHICAKVFDVFFVCVTSVQRCATGWKIWMNTSWLIWGAETMKHLKRYSITTTVIRLNKWFCWNWADIKHRKKTLQKRKKKRGMVRMFATKSQVWDATIWVTTMSRSTHVTNAPRHFYKRHSLPFTQNRSTTTSSSAKFAT